MYFHPANTRKEQMLNRMKAALFFLPPLALVASLFVFGNSRPVAPVASATPIPPADEVSAAFTHAGGVTTTVYTVYPTY